MITYEENIKNQYDDVAFTATISKDELTIDDNCGGRITLEFDQCDAIMLMVSKYKKMRDVANG